MKIMNFIKKYSLIIYFSLTFIISWGFILFLAGYENIPIDPDKSKNILPVLYISMLLGPVLSSLVLTGIDNGKEGYRRLLQSITNWRLNLPWYMLALFSAPLLAILTLTILSFFSAEFSPAILTSGNPSGLIINGLIAGIMVGIFEEIGWTGFAIERLIRKQTVVKIGLITGVIWGAWHFILFWENSSFTGIIPFSILISRLFTWLLPYRIFMTWLYTKTDSLLLVIFSHFSLVFTVTVLVPMTLSGKYLLIWLISWSIVLWLALAVIKKINVDVASS